MAKHPGGRPPKYSEAILKKARIYLDACEDEEDEFHATRGMKSDGYQRIIRVRLPTIEGLAVVLDVSRDTLYDWEKKHEQFSYILRKLRDKQAEMLIVNSLSGDYNSTIAKVLLTKHGYREGKDITTDDKPLPASAVVFEEDDES